jgi:hypothetical protein
VQVAQAVAAWRTSRSRRPAWQARSPFKVGCGTQSANTPNTRTHHLICSWQYSADTTERRGPHSLAHCDESGAQVACRVTGPAWQVPRTAYCCSKFVKHATASCVSESLSLRKASLGSRGQDLSKLQSEQDWSQLMRRVQLLLLPTGRTRAQHRNARFHP